MASKGSISAKKSVGNSTAKISENECKTQGKSIVKKSKSDCKTQGKAYENISQKNSRSQGAMGISNVFYGTKMLFDPYIPEVSAYVESMNGVEVELTQVVSQMSGPTIISLSDDLLQTKRMTIEDLLETSERCVATVLARTCELDINGGWFYRSCSKCATRITAINGQIYCDKCNMPRTDVPRFKVNIQVIDNTGSTTFVLFDRVLSQAIGRSTQDVLDSMDMANNPDEYPSDLDMFVDKRMLFKVEVSDGNLYRNWRSYTAKKLTMDEEIIKKFLALHGINDNNDEEEAAYLETVIGLANDDCLDKVERVDSSEKDDVVAVDSTVTPTSKGLGKRVVDSVQPLDDIEIIGSDASTTKEPKMMRVKIEDED